MRNPQNILITGASSGIGAALACHYASPVRHLFLLARRVERLEEIARICREKGAQCSVISLDVTDKTAMEEALTEIDKKKKLDLVIANAGISANASRVTPDRPGEQAERIFDVNVRGVFRTIHPVMVKMALRGKGQIAIISSLAGYKGAASAPAYCASKAAVRIYGQALRGAMADKGVEVNVISPGFVKSEITDKNDFPMPFLMSAEKAARKIAGGLARNKACIAFPWPMVWVVRLWVALPDQWCEWLFRRLPSKESV